MAAAIHTATLKDRSGRATGPGVLLQVGELSEGVLAVGAVVRLDAQVYAQVLSQVGGVGERLGAVGTLVRLGLRVGLGVDLHLGLGEEGERTHFASGGGMGREKGGTFGHGNPGLRPRLETLASLRK